MTSQEEQFFIGIDLGGKEKKTTGICILEKRNGGFFPVGVGCKKCEVVFGKDALKRISPYLKNTKAIAVDAPLTRGRGKGKMRLYEKFLSQSIFRREKVNPLPPALMPKFADFGIELKRKSEKRGFALDVNLIEVFPTLIGKITGGKLPQIILQRTVLCQTENQKAALICAAMAYLHAIFKTRYLGYKDGFLFLPETSFWTEEWKEKFYKAWREKPKLRYYRLKTNLFSK